MTASPVEGYEEALQLLVYLNREDRIGSLSAAESVIREAHRLGCAGASVIEFTEGFGDHHHIERSTLLSVSDRRGLQISIIDSPEKIEIASAAMERLLGEGFFVIRPVWRRRFKNQS